MKKILLILAIGSLLFGCAVPTEVIKKEVSVKDIRAQRHVRYVPIVYKSFNQYIQPNWVLSGNTAGDFAMGGAYYNGKTYLGGYGVGRLYSVDPLNLELNNTGEAVLSLVNYNGMVYATSENNDMAGQHTRLFRKGSGGWQEVGLSGYAAYFMTVWNNQLVVSTTRDLNSIDISVGDGNSFNRIATLSDWLWVPVVYRNELYPLGHSGGPGGPGSAKAVKWNGSSFVNVNALNNLVTEWQCGVEHNGYLYLGSGGWTIARGTSKAAVYRFDGVNVVEVKTDPGYHEVQALLSSKGTLYATFGQGFKYDNGGSKIWAMTNNSWREFGTFPCPQLYVMLEIPEGQIAAGGRQGTLNYFYNIFAPRGGS